MAAPVCRSCGCLLALPPGSPGGPPATAPEGATCPVEGVNGAFCAKPAEALRFTRSGERTWVCAEHADLIDARAKESEARNRGRK